MRASGVWPPKALFGRDDPGVRKRCIRIDDLQGLPDARDVANPAQRILRHPGALAAFPLKERALGRITENTAGIAVADIPARHDLEKPFQREPLAVGREQSLSPPQKLQSSGNLLHSCRRYGAATHFVNAWNLRIIFLKSRLLSSPVIRPLPTRRQPFQGQPSGRSSISTTNMAAAPSNTAAAPNT